MGTVYGSSRELGSECRGLAPVQRQHRGTTRSVACGSRIQLKMSVLSCCAATTRVSGGEAEPSRARQVVRAWFSRGLRGLRGGLLPSMWEFSVLARLLPALIRVRQPLASPRPELPDQSRLAASPDIAGASTIYRPRLMPGELMSRP